MDNSNAIYQKVDQNLEYEKCFDLLNSVYKFAEKFEVLDKYEILPCLNGSFKKKCYLKQNPGIDDELLKCIKSLDQDSTIQETIVDYRVKVENIREINFLEFYQNMNKMFMKSLDRKDVDAIQMIRKLNKTDDSTFFDKIETHVMTKEEECKFGILIEAHVNFIKNYLRETDFNSDELMKRWPFELIQNANDTVQEVNRKVKITFDFRDDKLIFCHDGEPFSNNTLLGLLYQCSIGKNNKKTTGKFGTGFLSTLIVSREIHLSGDLVSSSMSDKIHTGFDVRIVRKGSSPSELKEGVRAMENSFKKGRPQKGITTFEYIYPNNRDSYHKKVIETGLESLKNNISTVLILNRSIESITLKTNKDKIIYKLDNNDNQKIEYDIVLPLTVSITSNSSNSKEKYFVINRIEKVDNSTLQSISSKMSQMISSQNSVPSFLKIFDKKEIVKGKQKNEVDFSKLDPFDVRINCLIRINDNTNSISLNKGSNLFASYPMFGISKIKSPFIINSPDFELERERQYLLLKVDETKYGKKESLINQIIIQKSVDLYELIIKKACDEKCNDLFNLFRNLGDDVYESNHEFINNYFTNKLRSLIGKYPLFNTSSGLKVLNQIRIPYDESKDEQTNKELYNFVSRFISTDFNITVYEDCKNWVKITWGNLPIFTIDSFLNFISNKKNINNFKIGSAIEFMKDLYEFIFKVFNLSQNNILYVLNDHDLLINQSGDLKIFNDIRRINLPDILYKVLEIIKYDYKSLILHPEIKYLYDRLKFNEFENSEFVGKCVQNLNEYNAIEFMQFVLESDTNRELMYKYTKLLLNPNLEKVVLQYDDFKLIEGIFPEADKLVCKKLIVAIFNYNDLRNINFAEFIELLKKHLSYQEYTNANMEKLLFQKCLSDAEKKLNSCNKYINVECVNRENIELDSFLSDRKFNFRANGNDGNDIYYFIVKQSEYFTFNKYRFVQNYSDSNEHYILMILFDIELEDPNFMIFELLK